MSKNRPFLLVVIGSLDLGGAEKHLLSILPHLTVEYEIRVLTTSYAGALCQEFEQQGIPVIYKYQAGCGSPNKLRQLWRVTKNFWRALRYIQCHKPDIIHFFLPGSYLLGGYAAKLLGRKHLIMSRRSQNDYQKKHHRLVARLEHRLHRTMDVVLANSKKVATQLKGEGVTEHQLQLLYNGVDVARYSLESDASLRDTLNLTPNTLVLMIVANLFFYKGHRDLLEALAVISDQLPDDWVLLCVGRDSGELESLERQAARLDLSAHIRFLGQRTDIPQLMSISDIGLLVSHEEGFSNAILEFMACGKPMVVTRVGGNAEAIIDNECGFVVPAKNHERMAQALLALASDEVLRQRFGQAAYERVQSFFSLDRCVASYKSVYKTILQKPTLRSVPKILFVINNIGFVYSHRLPIMLGAAECGYEVHVATCFDPRVKLKHTDKLHYHHIDFNRNSINPITELKPIVQMMRLYRKIKPDLIHHMCKKSVLYGCLITRLMPKTPVANTVPGLGYLFISDSYKAKFIIKVLQKGFKIGFKRTHLKTIFQNDDDRLLFEKYDLVQPEQCVMIRGSGVDVRAFQPTPRDTQRPLVIIPTRLLWDKGVGEFVEAARRLKHTGARFALVGEVDPINPASIPVDTVRGWVHEGIVEHWGWCDDMVAVLKQADIVCLPSYREGLPKALLEAAACALPIVTTNAPGCKDVIVDGESGFIVAIKDPQHLAERLEQLIQSPSLRHEMGAKARERVVEHFSTDIIVAQSLDLYSQLIHSSVTSLTSTVNQ